MGYFSGYISQIYWARRRGTLKLLRVTEAAARHTYGYVQICAGKIRVRGYYPPDTHPDYFPWKVGPTGARQLRFAAARSGKRMHRYVCIRMHVSRYTDTFVECICKYTNLPYVYSYVDIYLCMYIYVYIYLHIYQYLYIYASRRTHRYMTMCA